MSVLERTQEFDDGDTEYKFQLLNLTPEQCQHMACQLQYRLEGGSEYGQAIYDIGLTDDGFPLGLSEDMMNASLRSLEDIVKLVPGANICAVDRHEVVHHAASIDDLYAKFMCSRKNHITLDKKWRLSREAKGKEGMVAFTRYVAEVIIRKDTGTYWETKIGIAGNVDCGKSTLLGVLVSGQYDNGRGRARLTIMKHKHEKETGRTSSVSQEIIGFNAKGEHINEKIAHGSTHTGHIGDRIEWSDIVSASSMIITFYDLAGHLKYLDQTIQGISSNKLDYLLTVVGANMTSSNLSDNTEDKEKWMNMTKEHMAISLALGVPCIVVVTKIDSTDQVVRKDTISALKKLINKGGVAYELDTIDNVRKCVDLMSTSTKVIPIVQISNVTGEGHDILKKLLHFLPPRRDYVHTEKYPAVLQIQEIFRKVEGTSMVLAGNLISGTLRVAEGGQTSSNIRIGPFSDGTFLETRIRSLHVKKMDVGVATAGRYVCVGLPKSAIDKGGDKIRKGMYALGSKLQLEASWEFWADVRITKNTAAKISVGYTPVCHIGHIKQTCKILKIMEKPKQNEDEVLVPKDVLAAGDDARVLMRFCFRPELLFRRCDLGMEAQDSDSDSYSAREADPSRLIFREGKTKGIGTIVMTTDVKHTPLDNRLVTKEKKQGPTRRQRRLARERDGLHVPPVVLEKKGTSTMTL